MGLWESQPRLLGKSISLVAIIFLKQFIYISDGLSPAYQPPFAPPTPLVHFQYHTAETITWNGFASMVLLPWSYTNNYRIPTLLYNFFLHLAQGHIHMAECTLNAFPHVPTSQVSSSPMSSTSKTHPNSPLLYDFNHTSQLLVLGRPKGLPPSSPLNSRSKGSIHNGYLNVPWILVTPSPISQEMLIQQLKSLGPVLGLHEPPSPIHLPFLDPHYAL